MKHRVTLTVEVDSGDRLLSNTAAATLARNHMSGNYRDEVERQHEVAGPYTPKPEGHEGGWDGHSDKFTATTREVRFTCEVVREPELILSAAPYRDPASGTPEPMQ